MKKTGNKSDFIEDRDSDLLRSFMEVLRTTVDIPLRDMYGMAAERPATRFWVSEGRAAIVIGAMSRGVMPEKALPLRREMYDEIFRRVCARMAAEPGLCLTHAVREVIYEPAPKFYITPTSAKTIIYRVRRRRRNRAAAFSLLKK